MLDGLIQSGYCPISVWCIAALLLQHFCFNVNFMERDTKMAEINKPQADAAVRRSAEDLQQSGRALGDALRQGAEVNADVARRGTEAGAEAVRRTTDAANDTARRSAQAVADTQRQIVQDAAQRIEEVSR